MPVRRHPVAPARPDSRLATVPLDVALAGRLRAIYERVRARKLRLAEVFYAKLFAAAPHLRPLFRGDIAVQAEKLMASLDAVVRNLENPGQNTEMLAALGKRHAAYGARPEHYDLVVDLLVESTAELLGPDEPRAHLNDLRIAIRLISDQMIAAAEARG